MSLHRFNDIMTYDIMFKKVSQTAVTRAVTPLLPILYIIFINRYNNVMMSSPFIYRGFVHDIIMTFSRLGSVWVVFVLFVLLAVFCAGGVS